ncbi:hypothetical protein V5O48_003795 [Marasmius crinis-equi]|uniref:MYND-type domain-containing protein n=1 Tax=Marasmius crinis-equi TaxID=585013 RepID=A0ABR3FRW2_9AGAR
MNIAFALDYMDEYVLRAKAEFPSIISCIHGLEALGTPPQFIDISDPGDDVERAFMILAALTPYVSARNSTPRDVARTWETVLGRWVIFVLWKVVLTPERPTTPPGNLHFHRSLTSAMILLQFTGEDCRHIKRSTPILQHLVCQCWYLLVDIEHPVWGLCSLALLNLIDAGEDTVSGDIHPPLPTLYHDEGNIARIMIKHLKLNVHYIRTRRVEKLDAVHVFLMLHMPGYGPFKKVDPMFTPDNIDAALEAVADLLRVLVRAKQTFLRDLTVDDSGFRYARDLVMMTSEIISGLMVRASRIERLLRGKILCTLMHYGGRYCQLGEGGDDEVAREISVLLAGILDNISKFLVYPGVLREFSRGARGITANKDDLLRKGMDKLWESWENARDRASSFSVVRSAFKNSIGDCSYYACVLRLIGNDNCGVTKYWRCAQCNVAVYCSVECQKSHWRQCHRLECLQIADIRKAGKLPVTQADNCFFESLLDRYLSDHADELSGRVRRCSATLRGYVFSNRFVEAGRRLSIVRVAFDTARIPDGACGQALDEEAFKALIESQTFTNTAWLEEVERQWITSSPDQLCVVAVFPKATGLAWPVPVVVQFPLEKARA